MTRRILMLALSLALVACDNTPPNRKPVRDDLASLADQLRSKISQNDFHLRFLRFEADLEVLRAAPNWNSADEMRAMDIAITNADSIWRILSQPDCKLPDGKLTQDCLGDNPRLVDALARYGVQGAETMTVDEIVKPVLAGVAKAVPPALASLQK